jgi:ubiquinone/menaquinone biosynthesis C-methylase UbiE
LPKTLRSPSGRRFLELEGLIKEFFSSQVRDPEASRAIASQLLNVINNCDEITYEEEGTAEAYALLHFLDRYHRFQLIFKLLFEKKLMPMRNAGLKILDVGTGPGPSMFAASDFYNTVLSKNINGNLAFGDHPFSIDYVERSSQFRNWLHHFTEFTNYYSPTQKPWAVPYHHGTFYDFKNLEFDQESVEWFTDNEGNSNCLSHITKHRFDLIVFSNFLTTKEQTANFSTEIENCARFLKNNGLLIIVGARSSSNKYKEVYEEIEKTILSGSYSTRKITAKCYKVDIGNPKMGYSWGDEYGQRLKSLIKYFLDNLDVSVKDFIPVKAAKVLGETIQPSYKRAIEWELMVFRKKARPRTKIIKPN